MDVELLEVRDFLAGVPPFDALPREALDRLPRALSIRYLRRGSAFPPEDAGGAFLYLVRQGAIELRNERDVLVAKYGEGDLHGAACGDDSAAARRGFAVEDTLLYLLPCSVLESLRAEHRAFAQHFASSFRDRLRRWVEALPVAPALGGGLLAVSVGSLVAREPAQVGPDTSIEDAARVMARERISSLLVVREGRIEGIVTDRDLRRRCLAAGVPPTRAVREIMTAEVRTIAPEAAAFEALLAMARLGIHHLPVVSGERVLGVVTTTDLVRHESANPAYLATGIRRSRSVAELAQASARIPELQVQLVAAGVGPRNLGQAVGALVDAVTQRLVDLALAEELGPAPVPWAWIACGSLARHEQTAVSDQDNALLLSDDYDPAADGAWFETLARFVNDGLATCGFPRCPGDVMASNPMWRQPVSGWRNHFDGWIDEPQAKALMHASIFFDMRAVTGDAALLSSLEEHVRRRARASEVFLARLAANALGHRAPLGFFREFVVARGGEHEDTLDLKHDGLLPIIDLARLYALASGSAALGTVERLRDAAERHALSRAGAEDLEQAFDLVAALRARHQAAQVKRGLAPDSRLRPDELSRAERARLKDAFAAIRHHQEALATMYRARSFL